MNKSYKRFLQPYYILNTLLIFTYPLYRALASYNARHLRTEDWMGYSRE